MGKKGKSKPESKTNPAVVLAIGAGVLVALFIAVMIVINVVKNNRGATETRAKAAAVTFAQQNGLPVARLSCAGDSNSDGYGSCSILTVDGKRIRLMCPCDFWDVEVWGASGCKEEFSDIQSLGGFSFTGQQSGSPTGQQQPTQLTPQQQQPTQLTPQQQQQLQQQLLQQLQQQQQPTPQQYPAPQQ